MSTAVNSGCTATSDALKQLATLPLRLASIVECRFFGGRDEGGTAEALGIFERTVRGGLDADQGRRGGEGRP